MKFNNLSKKQIALIIAIVIVIALFLVFRGTNKTVVGTWQGSGSIYITNSGAVTGSIVGSYWNYYVSQTSFDDHSITIEYSHEITNQLEKIMVYEYRLEDGGNTLVILNEATTYYDMYGNECSTETKTFANKVYDRVK